MKPDKITDIRTFSSINTSRKYFLDTNVLYWYTYPRFTADTLPRNAVPYYDFVDSLVASGNPLITSIYNVTELINVIEKHEYDIYCEMHPDENLTRKDYRKIDDERSSLKLILTTTLQNAKAICNIIDFNFTTNILNCFTETLTDHRCDVFDFAILSHCVSSDHMNIISDDSDFSTFEKITLYTANNNCL